MQSGPVLRIAAEPAGSRLRGAQEWLRCRCTGSNCDPGCALHSRHPSTPNSPSSPRKIMEEAAAGAQPCRRRAELCDTHLEDLIALATRSRHACLPEPRFRAPLGLHDPYLSPARNRAAACERLRGAAFCLTPKPHLLSCPNSQLHRDRHTSCVHGRHVCAALGLPLPNSLWPTGCPVSASALSTGSNHLIDPSLCHLFLCLFPCLSSFHDQTHHSSTFTGFLAQQSTPILNH